MSEKKPKIRHKNPRERRQFARREILDSFQVFLVIPKQGSHRIYLNDVSEGGLKFFHEPIKPYQAGDQVKAQVYINPTLHLDLKIKIKHVVSDEKGGQSVGCELLKPVGQKSLRAYNAYKAFVKLLDDLVSLLK